MQKFLVVVESSETGFTASCPEVPGCTAMGASIEDAVEELKSALLFHLAEAGELPVPQGLARHLESEEFRAYLEPEFYVTEIEVVMPDEPFGEY